MAMSRFVYRSQETGAIYSSLKKAKASLEELGFELVEQDAYWTWEYRHPDDDRTDTIVKEIVY